MPCVRNITTDTVRGLITEISNWNWFQSLHASRMLRGGSVDQDTKGIKMCHFGNLAVALNVTRYFMLQKLLPSFNSPGFADHSGLAVLSSSLIAFRFRLPSSLSSSLMGSAELDTWLQLGKAVDIKNSSSFMLKHAGFSQKDAWFYLEGGDMSPRNHVFW